MTEYRLVGTAVVNERGTRKRFAFNHEFPRAKPDRAAFDRVFNRYCDLRGYYEPDLDDWYLA